MRWLKGKGDFLRWDRMLRSNLELLDAKNHQDPKNHFLRGDRLVHRALLKRWISLLLAWAGEVRLKEPRGEKLWKRRARGDNRKFPKDGEREPLRRRVECMSMFGSGRIFLA